MPKQYWTPVLLLAEICFFMLTNVAGAEVTEHEFVFWPDQDVNFAIVTDNSNSTHLTINGIKREHLAKGLMRLVPQVPREKAKRLAPTASLTTKVPLDFQWQVVMINQIPFVLSREGRAIQLPKVSDNAIPEVSPIKEAIAIGYHRADGLFVITIVTHRRVFTFEDTHAASIDEVVNKIDFEQMAIDRGWSNKIPLDDFRNDELNVYAISEKRNYRFQTTVGNWFKRRRDAFLNDTAIPTYPTASSSFGVSAGRATAAMPQQTTTQSPSAPSGKSSGKTKPVIKAEIPKGVAQLRHENAEKALFLAELRGQIFDQDPALQLVDEQISEFRKSDGLTPKVLIFGGVSGGGKTYAGEIVAEKVHPGAVFHMNGNEYSAHSGSLEHNRLLVSHKGDGALVQFAKAHLDGFSLLIDEADKMHPDVWLKLLEFYRSGKLTDSAGKEFTVRNLLIILTSNRGALRMFPVQMHKRSREELEQRARSLTQEELKAHYTTKEGPNDPASLPTELMNRVAAIIPFMPTTKEAAVRIAETTSAKQARNFHDRYLLHFTFEKTALQQMAYEAWLAGANGHTINREIKKMMSAILDEAPDKLDLNDNDNIDVQVEDVPNAKPLLRASANGRSFTIPIGLPSVRHPLKDLEQRKLFREMSAQMNQIVIGQSQTISDVANGIISRIGKNSGKPYVALLIGASGIGKSEISRALALVRYKDTARVRTLPMGEIGDDQKFDATFGVAGHMQSGDLERPFEQILREFPDGCIINLGEISNMGGRDPLKKAALFMRLYNLFEEGIYISPRDGRVFELHKYTFMLDGNDLEEAFLGVTDDDMLMERYNQINDPDSIREKLLASGIPNAFLNRVDTISLMKPLLRKEVLAVSSKIWVSETALIRKDFPEVSLEVSPNFLEQLSWSFFSAGKGGRSVKSVIETRVVGLLNSVLMNEKLDSLDFSDLELKIGLRDSASRRPYHISTAPRVVEFTVDLEKNGEVIHSEKLNVTGSAPKQLLVSPKDATLLSGHEVGHAEGNDPALTNQRFRYVTIRSGSIGALKYLGYAGSEQVPGTDGSNMSRRELIGHLRAIYSGRIAQEFLGFPPDRGWGNDLKTMRKLVSEHLVTYGLEEGFVGLPLDKNGEPIVDSGTATRLRESVTEILEEARGEATEHLTANWPLIRSMMAELLRKGHMDAKRREEIRAAYQRGELASNRNRKEPTPYDPNEKRACKAFAQ